MRAPAKPREPVTRTFMELDPCLSVALLIKAFYPRRRNYLILGAEKIIHTAGGSVNCASKEDSIDPEIRAEENDADGWSEGTVEVLRDVEIADIF